MPMGLRSSLMLGGAGSVPFQPNSLGSALVAWWDPDQGITKNSVSNRVSAWVDRQSGFTVVQNSGGYQPLYVAAATEMNSRPSLYFDAQPVYLVVGSAPTALRVQQQASTYLTISRGYKDHLGSSSTAPGSFLLMRYNQKVREHVWYTGSVLATQDGLTTLSNTTRALVGQMSDGTKLYPIVNSGKDNTGANCGVPTTPTAPFFIGWRGSSSSESFLGHMGDVLVFNRALTDAELLKIYQWASFKWGI